jgi:hypothetical protein
MGGGYRVRLGCGCGKVPTGSSEPVVAQPTTSTPPTTGIEGETGAAQ